MKKHPKTSLNNNHQKKTNPLLKYYKTNLKISHFLKKIHEKNIRKKGGKKHIPLFPYSPKKRILQRKFIVFIFRIFMSIIELRNL